MYYQIQYIQVGLAENSITMDEETIKYIVSEGEFNLLACDNLL